MLHSYQRKEADPVMRRCYAAQLAAILKKLIL